MKLSVARDTEGYLFNPDDWNMEIAISLAEEEEIKLNDTHWLILHFIRHYYSEHNVAPDVRHVISYLASISQSNKKEAKKTIFNLFPYGYVKQACKIAGMIKPRAWSTG